MGSQRGVKCHYNNVVHSCFAVPQPNLSFPGNEFLPTQSNYRLQNGQLASLIHQNNVHPEVSKHVSHRPKTWLWLVINRIVLQLRRICCVAHAKRNLLWTAESSYPLCGRLTRKPLLFKRLRIVWAETHSPTDVLSLSASLFAGRKQSRLDVILK